MGRTKACKLVGYRRVSTKEQGQSGLGLEAQQSAIDDHVKSSGCVLLSTYNEIESGKRCDRPELAKAIAHAKRSGATLVIAKMDRLARNVHFLSGLMEAGVEFVACDNPAANRLTVHILAAVAEDEAKRISDRTKAALAAYKARGGTLGAALLGSRLSNEDRDKGRSVANATQSRQAIAVYFDLIPQMTAMKASGMSLKAIADQLNADGHTTRTEAKWSAVQVMRTLKRTSV